MYVGRLVCVQTETWLTERPEEELAVQKQKKYTTVTAKHTFHTTLSNSTYEKHLDY